MEWNVDQVISLAPDSATAGRARQLAEIRKWNNLYFNDRAIWAECISSSRIYNCFIDLKGPAFKCNCPSRKFPCKHSLGLLLLYSLNQDQFNAKVEMPQALSDWLEVRDKRSEKASSSQIKAPDAKAKSDASKAKTRDKRLDQMVAGMEELNAWMDDIIRQGVANVEQAPESFYQNIAARMVDAKLGGLRRRILRLSSLPYTGINWPEAYLSQLAEIFLLAKGFSQMESLPENLQLELLSLVGVNQKKEDLIGQPEVEDDWMVMAQLEEQQDRLKMRRSWLKGAHTNQMALILDYAFGNDSFQNHYTPGSVFLGTVIYYPASYKSRGILKSQETIKAKIGEFDGYPKIENMLEDYAQALSKNPWISRFPTTFERVIPVSQGDQYFIVDVDKKFLEIKLENLKIWTLLAISGGGSIDIFGEWDGKVFYPLSAVVDGRYLMI